MAAPKGNKFYKLRKKDGRDPIYTAEELRVKANEYFEEVLKNPFKVQEVVKMRDHFEYAEVEKMRPFTRGGLCNHLGIVEKTLYNYKKNEDLLHIVTHIEQVIDTQQFEGAAAGLFNASIVARKLGLTDKTETKQEGDITISFKD